MNLKVLILSLCLASVTCSVNAQSGDISHEYTPLLTPVTTSDSFTDKPGLQTNDMNRAALQDAVTSGEELAGRLNYMFGIEAGFSTRGSFEDAVCEPQSVEFCDSDTFTFFPSAYFEMNVFTMDLPGPTDLQITGGLAFSRGGVDFSQRFDLGSSSPSYMDQSGRVTISTLELYGSGRAPLNLLGGQGNNSPLALFFKLGFAEIWNEGEFEFNNPGGGMMEYTRKHNGLNFTGGMGLDYSFGNGLGLRFQVDYMGGGADSHVGFGAGVSISPRDIRLGNRFF